MWITSEQVSILLQTDLSTDPYIDGLIVHAQGLAEGVIGTQEEPVSAALQSELANIVARMWQAGKAAQGNPAGYQSETAGPFTIQDTRGGTVGLGLTDRERKALRRAAGISPLAVVSTTRNDWLETPGRDRLDELSDPADPLDEWLGGLR